MNLSEDHANYNCEITTAEGTVHRIFGDVLSNEHHNHWKGWHCDAGKTRFFIDKNFDIWSGVCKNDYLGNMLTTWEPKNNGVICTREVCSRCTDDLLTKKSISN